MTTSSAIEEKPDQTGANSGIAPVPFPVSQDSPFSDGYDIASERDALADLIAAENPDESDPRWSRFVLLCEREEQLRQTKADYKLRQGAENIVPDDVARGVMELGQLVDEEPDTMTLHTKEAFRAFTGRQPDAEGKLVHIAGGKRFAAVLKSIWYLSGNDNPYADWLLVMMHERLSELRAKLEGASAEKQKLIDQVKAHGLSFSVMRSRNPKVVELGFRSPYGYATTGVIAVFDYYVRMVKTLIRKDRLSDEEGRIAIRHAGRELRALFLEPIRWERFLLRQEMRALSRADFLPSAEEGGRKRVKAAVGLFGEVPRPIFTGAVVPRHTRRRVRLSQAELRLLEQASLTAEDGSDGDETALL